MTKGFRWFKDNLNKFDKLVTLHGFSKSTKLTILKPPIYGQHHFIDKARSNKQIGFYSLIWKHML